MRLRIGLGLGVLAACSSGSSGGGAGRGGGRGGGGCGGDSLLEIMAARNDTAVGLLLLATDSGGSGLGVGSYAVMPAKVFIPWRPRSVAALRLVEVAAVRQYESGSGQVTVTDADSTNISGTLELRLVAVGEVDSLHVTGGFHRLRIVP